MSIHAQPSNPGLATPSVLSALVKGPAAWTGRELSSDDFRVGIAPDCREEIRRTLADLKAHPLPTVLLTPQEYPMPACAAMMAEVRRMLDDGPGFALLDRIAVEEMSVEEATSIYWLLSAMIARPVAQKLDGTMIYDVRDTGQTATPGSGIRRDKTNSELTYHIDNSYNHSPPEYVGLLCVRPAKRGALSRVVSFATVHNEILRRSRNLQPRFYRPYPFDRQREYLAGEDPIFSAPIFEYDGSQLRARLSLHQIHGGYTLAGKAMDEATAASLELLETIFEDEALAVEFELKPGWIQYVNNRAVGHSRTSFEDFPELERKRHLIRLWLRDAGRRAYQG